MKKFIFIFLILILANISKSQDRWIYITTGNDGTDAYLDSKSLRVDKDDNTEKIVWIKFKNDNEFQTFEGEYVTFSIVKYSIYCSSSSYKIIDGVIYLLNGTHIGIDKSNNEFGLEESVVPNSIMETIYKYVCKNY